MKANTPGLSLRALNGKFGVAAQGVDASVPLDRDSAEALRAALIAC